MHSRVKAPQLTAPTLLLGAIPIEVSGDSPQPKPVYRAGGDQPRVNPAATRIRWT